jgi:hypothetical protein
MDRSIQSDSGTHNAHEGTHMMLLPIVSPYDDDPVKKDSNDSDYDQSLKYFMTDSHRKEDQARKVRGRGDRQGRPYPKVIRLHEKRIG